MTKTNWAELIDKNFDTILAEAKDACRSAFHNTACQYSVYMDGDGSVYTEQDIAGGNSVPEDVWNGTRDRICFTTYHDPGDEDYIPFLLENLSDETREKLEQLEADEDGIGVDIIKDAFPEEFEKANNRYIDYYIEEQVYDEVRNQADELIEEYAKEEKKQKQKHRGR